MRPCARRACARRPCAERFARPIEGEEVRASIAERRSRTRAAWRLLGFFAVQRPQLALRTDFEFHIGFAQQCDVDDFLTQMFCFFVIQVV